MSNDSQAVKRRSFLSRLGVGAAAFGALGAAPVLQAQAGSAGRWQPGRHTQDNWMEQLPGKHRFLLDTTTATGFGMQSRNRSMRRTSTGCTLNRIRPWR